MRPGVLTTMQEILKLVDGRKTYLVATVAVIYLFGADQHWWTESTRVTEILMFGGLAALRAGMKKPAEPTSPATPTPTPTPPNP